MRKAVCVTPVQEPFPARLSSSPLSLLVPLPVPVLLNFLPIYRRLIAVFVRRGGRERRLVGGLTQSRLSCQNHSSQLA